MFAGKVKELEIFNEMEMLYFCLRVQRLNDKP